MYESLVTILASVAASGALAVAVVWLLKSWISERLKNAMKHEYDTKLESHKAQLKASLDTKLEIYKSKLAADNTASTEHLKSQLQITAIAHQIRYGNLHEKVAEVVATTYAKLHDFINAINYYTNELELPGSPSRKDRRLALGVAMSNFTDYFGPRRLYLTKELVGQIKAFEDKLHDLARKFRLGIEEGGDDRHPESDTWLDTKKSLRNDAAPLFAILENEFRTILGVASVTAGK